MNSPQQSSREKGAGGPPLPDNSLPPVEAPNSGFILQLFLIPMVIVTVIIMVWLMFSWLAHMGSDPRKIVADIKKMNSASWQKAHSLANMLRHPDYEHLKEDQQLARELSQLLEAKLDEASPDDRNVRLRRFLCRALGEFRTIEVLPALLEAVKQEKKPQDIVVRRSALAALAVLISNIGPEKMREQEELFDALVSASQDRGEGASDEERAAIRYTAAYALGVLGGKDALDRLTRMMTDAHPEVRYNAATGLARHGDSRAAPTLVEMLDPQNTDAVRNERSESAMERKRMDVLSNGVRATIKLMQTSADQDADPLVEALQKLVADKELQTAVRTEAREALAVIEDVAERRSAKAD